MNRNIFYRRLVVRKSLALAGMVAFWAGVVPAEMRNWTLSSGQSLEAEYLRTTLSDEALLKKADGSEAKVPMSALSPGDLKYIALQHPPKLKVEFGKQSWRSMVDSAFILDPPPVFLVTFQYNVRLRQTDFIDYGYNLHLEYYAIGRQLQNKNKYCLLYKYEQDFVLNDENKRELEWKSPKVNMPMEFTLDETTFGRDYLGGLALVYDQRGEIVAYKTSKNWLFEGRELLRKLPVGAFFDNKCTRVHPSGAMKSRNQ